MRVIVKEIEAGGIIVEFPDVSEAEVDTWVACRTIRRDGFYIPFVNVYLETRP